MNRMLHGIFLTFLIMAGLFGSVDHSVCETTAVKPLVIAPEDGDRLTGQNKIEVQFKIGSVSSAASKLFASTAIIPDGASVINHLHEIDEEMIYVLEGSIIVTLDDTEHNVGPGGMVFIPPGTWMAISNRSGKSAKVLGVLPRAELEQCIRTLYQTESRDTHEDRTETGASESLHSLCRMKLPETP